MTLEELNKLIEMSNTAKIELHMAQYESEIGVGDPTMAGKIEVELSVEELKRLAKKKGYKLIPITKVEKLLPCTCGRQRRETRLDVKTRRLVLVCPKCGRRAIGETEKEVRENWNKGIRDQMEAKA